jgi:hypothetical protein
MRRKLPAFIIVVFAVLAFACLAAADDYLKTTHYKVYYDKWEDVAKALNASYFDTAYDTASKVIGGGLDSLMSIYFYSDSKSNTNGTYSPSKNEIRLNIKRDDDTSSATLTNYAAVLAHETTHAIFNYISHNSSDAANWLDEGLAFYVGDCAYPKADAYSTTYLTAQLKYYSDDGEKKQSWYQTGIDYLADNTSALAMWSLPAIGNFLYSAGGSTAILNALQANGRGDSLESALQSGFGKSPGMYSTDTAGDTLYVDYYRFYYGSS